MSHREREGEGGRERTRPGRGKVISGVPNSHVRENLFSLASISHIIDT